MTTKKIEKIDGMDVVVGNTLYLDAEKLLRGEYKIVMDSSKLPCHNGVYGIKLIRIKNKKRVK